MENVNEEKRKFRMMLVFPLLVLPFLTLGFWALGGGKDVPGGNEAENTTGLKTELPSVHLNEAPTDKLSYYQQAQADSAKQAELLRHDPSYPHDGLADRAEMEFQLGEQGDVRPYDRPVYGFSGNTGTPGSQEAQIYERLKALQATLDAPPAHQEAGPAAALVDGADVDRLEKMMQMMQGGEAEDPELHQLSGMLESILDIQHPGRVEERLKKASLQNKGQVFSVSAQRAVNPVTVLEAHYSDSLVSAGFFSLDEIPAEMQVENAIRAVIHETQTLVDGAVVKLRLLSEIFVNGTRIAKDHLVYGIARLDGERLKVTVDHIRHGQSLLPVRLAVFDMDGLDGIHVPGAIGRDVAKQSGTSALQGISLGTLDPSIGAQAASAGIELSKTLLGKKVKLIKVTVKAGYQVLLLDENKKNN